MADPVSDFAPATDSINVTLPRVHSVMAVVLMNTIESKPIVADNILQNFEGVHYILRI